MTQRLTAACIQTNAASEIETNLERIEPMIRSARERGADLITTPENVSLIICGRDRLLARASTESEHPAIAFFTRMAQETGAWLLAGSIAVKVDSDHVANRSYMFAPSGEITARYDKIHMFDANLGANECYRESSTYRPGHRAVIAETPWGKIGLTICYDLRFPRLYNALALAGADILMAPAAFTVPTGKLHWHVLLRARAIETGCYVLAPAQCGVHDNGRRTYGHSLIVEPSGAIVAEADGEEPGIIMAELDLEKVAVARRQLPNLQHDCDFFGP